MTSPTYLPIHELAAQYASRRLSPVDVVDEFIAQIERLEPALHAFVKTNAASARLAAEAADKAIRSGHAVGPLHGVPIAVKDLVEIEGEIVTAGSAAWANHRATRTATLYRKLMAAGMINLGKTHTVEFAYGGWGTNQRMGTPWNPWDATTHRVPGGSSSGSAVAVAARMAPCAIGTDTGGSVRIPAAFNGITGLKATIGRISAYGVVPASPTFDTPGPLTRDIEDAALLLTVLQGSDLNDRRTLGVSDAEPMRALRRGVKGLRLARLPQSERAAVDAEILAAYDTSVDCLANLGAEIVDISFPESFLDLGRFLARIGGAEVYLTLGELAADKTAPLDEDVRPRLLAGSAFSARDYLAALAEWDQAKREFHKAIADVDALLTPTVTKPAPIVASISQADSPTVFSRWVNIYELCAVTVPNGFTALGLPSSLQIACRGFDEPLALRIGYAYKSAHTWHMRVPSMTE